MKKFLAFIFVAIFAGLLVMSLDQNTNYVPYGEANTENRISDKFINKDVLGNQKEVIYNETSDLEEGSANIVTSIVANYRSFDTLGEVTVLFTAALGVSLLLGNKKKKRMASASNPNFILNAGAKATFPIILMVGVIMSIHGHLTPGGGFPGGAIISIGILLLYLSDPDFRVKITGFKLLEGFMGLLYITVGILGLILGSYFLENFLGSGTIGTLLSAGVIPIVYVLIGLKVGSELTSVVDDFLTEEEGM